MVTAIMMEPIRKKSKDAETHVSTKSIPHPVVLARAFIGCYLMEQRTHRTTNHPRNAKPRLGLVWVRLADVIVSKGIMAIVRGAGIIIFRGVLLKLVPTQPISSLLQAVGLTNSNRNSTRVLLQIHRPGRKPWTPAQPEDPLCARKTSTKRPTPLPEPPAAPSMDTHAIHVREGTSS